jgi:hypothetical protein
LQTVNPAILSLTLPPVKLVRAAYINQLSSAIEIGGPCYTIKDKDACAQACIKKNLTDTECVCRVIEEGVWSDFAKVSVGAATVAVGGGISAELGMLKAAGSALNALKSGGLKLATSLMNYAKANPFTFAAKTVGTTAKVTTAGYLASMGYALLPESQDNGQEGICLPLALKSIPPGGTCFVDEKNCVDGSKCVSINSNPPYGMCVSGAEGTACSGDDSCNMVNNTKLECCFIAYDLGTCQKSCTSRPAGSSCASGSDCSGGICANVPSFAGYSKPAASNVCTSGAIGDVCSSPSECNGSVAYCPASLYQCAGDCPSFTRCSDWKSTNQPCCTNGECTSKHCIGGHPSTYKCSVTNNVCDDASCGICE